MCGMGNMCNKVCGLLVLLAGLMFLGSGLGYLGMTTAHIGAGALLGLYGLALLCHAMGMCPNCKNMKC